MEGDPTFLRGRSATNAFLSTPSGWRATFPATRICYRGCISIHALRVEGDKVSNTIGSDPSISIHALRVEGDATEAANKAEQAISIHALRVEGDNHRLADLEDIERFLSTPSGWRATRKIRCLSFGMIYFYPRPPGGGRPMKAYTNKLLIDFYPRPPGGGRPLRRKREQPHRRFLSTPSGWRATTRR